MKKSLLTSLASLLLVGCADTEFLGTEEAQNTINGEKPILFTSESAPLTRADKKGKDAATLLNNNYVVMGVKGDGTTANQKVVFNHYNIEWTDNTAGSTETNVANWEYVGKTPHDNAFSGDGALPSSAKQSIKYWDYSTSQYDFAAFSYGKADKSDLTLSPIDLAKIGNDGTNDGTTDKSAPVYTVKGKVSDLIKTYVSNLVTVPTADYNKTVTPRFRQMGAKVRIAIYETVPGYAVKDVKFYYGNNRDKLSEKPVLYAVKQVTNTTTNKVHLVPTDVLPDITAETKGSMKVYFPTVGLSNKEKTDYNKAHVVFSGTQTTTGTSGTTGNLTSKLEFNSLSYSESYEGVLYDKDASASFLGTTSNTATYAGDVNGVEKAYELVLPYGAGNDLKLHVDYTLVSVDGSGETIDVKSASAIVPAVYTNWQSNYAYTYLFKISKNSNGTTGTPAGGGSGDGDPDDPTNPGNDPTDPDTPDPNNPAGLYPITFDAVVMDFEDGIQETITTVADPSITTYAKGVDPTAGIEYTVSKSIYVSVKNAAGVTLSNSNVKLYTATVQDDALQPIDENSIANALMNGKTNAAGTTWTVTDAAGKKLTVTSATGLSVVTEIAAADAPDGNAVSGNFAKFTPSAAGTYVFEYIVSEPVFYEDVDAYNTAKNTTLTAAEFAVLPNSQKVMTPGKKYYKIIIVH